MTDCLSIHLKVVRVEETKDHAVSGQWVVTVKHVQTGMVVSHSVNAVMLCTGPYAKPFMPIYDGKWGDSITCSQSVFADTLSKLKLFIDIIYSTQK